MVNSILAAIAAIGSVVLGIMRLKGDKPPSWLPEVLALLDEIRKVLEKNGETALVKKIDSLIGKDLK